MNLNNNKDKVLKP